MSRTFRAKIGCALTAMVAIPLSMAQAAIPTSNQALWLRGDAGVETGGTASGTTFTAGSAAADTNVITAWRDQSANSFDAYPKDLSANASVTYEPKYHTTGGPNGQPYVEFNLTAGAEYARLGLNTALLTGTTDFSVLAVVRINSGIAPTGEKVVGENYGSGNGGGLEFIHSTGTLIVY
jgi:hypothetical protein